MIRPEVAAVVGYAPLPPEDHCTAEFVDRLQADIERLPCPLTIQEADSLVAVLATPDDADYFGLLMAVRAAIESAPTIPPAVWTSSGPWVAEMRELAIADGATPPPSTSH